MFFIITPPEMTVERAWTRGLKVGRYKAVEDLLAHNVEPIPACPSYFSPGRLPPESEFTTSFSIIASLKAALHGLWHLAGMEK
jgi:hypothetical protein